MKDQLDVTCYFFFTSYVLNMFRTLIYPSSGACDCVDELPHRSSCSQFIVCWRVGEAYFGWCSFCWPKHNIAIYECPKHVEHIRSEIKCQVTSSWCYWNFSLTKNPSDHIMALGLTQPLTEMNTRSVTWGVKMAGA